MFNIERIEVNLEYNMKYNLINVLLIEDNPGDAFLIQEMLEEISNLKFSLHNIQYLDEGLNYLQKNRVDIILLDLNLPDSSGLDTFLKIKDTAPMIPIVILSGLNDEAIAINAVKSDAQDYLIKGKVDSSLLVRSISYAIERKSIKEELLKHRDHLEDLVEERTVELQVANDLLQKEIEEHKLAEEALKESEEKFRELFNNANDMITLVEVKEKGLLGNFLEINNMGILKLGYTRDELLNMGPKDIVPPDKIAEISKNVAELKKEGHATFERINMTKNGIKIPFEVNTHLFKLNGRSVALAISRDISERKKTEKLLKKSLDEKEMFLKEIHHRVKNNLMVISSLLSLQSRYIKDKKTLDIFKDSQNRARSMALIHERLYNSSDLKRINFGEYIQTLTMELFRTYMSNSSYIKLNMDVEDVMIDINTAVPLGLIVNELISNSMKHAFFERETGEINVNFKFSHDNFILLVKDNGIGFPEELDFKNTDSLGLRLVNSLTNQIHGDIQLKVDNGSEFKIKFKEKKY